MPNLTSLVAKHNPFYLLSAFSMLLGCLMLSRALVLEPGHAGKLVLLIGVLNLYEGLLIGLALFLIMGRGLVRDGRLLLWLEAVFLVDATFLGSELYASDLRTGVLVAGALLVLALLKLGVIARGLRIPFGPLWLALVPLSALLAVPGIFAALAQAHLLTLPVVYALWWALALLMVGQAACEGHRSEAATTSRADAGAATLSQALNLLPFVSLAAHLVAAGWVQGLEFYASLLGPPFVALGLRCVLRDVPSAPGKGSLRWPAAATLVSLGAPSALVMPGMGGVHLSPLRVTLVAVGLVYLLAYRVHRRRAFAWGAGLCLAGAGAGHSLSAMASSAAWLCRTLFSRSGRLLPRTTGQWGTLAVGLSFALLALGARLSLQRSPTALRDSSEG